MLTTEFGKSAIYQLIPSVVTYVQYNKRHIKKPPLLFVGLLRGTVPLPIHTLDAEGSALLVLPLKLTHLRTNQEDAFYKINHILLGRTVQHRMQIHAVRALCSSRYEATSGNSD